MMTWLEAKTNPIIPNIAENEKRTKPCSETKLKINIEKVIVMSAAEINITNERKSITSKGYSLKLVNIWYNV